MTNANAPGPGFPHRSDELISVHDAFSAMHAFLLAFWERDGKPDDSMVNILSWTASAEDGGPWKHGPADPAMWTDWLAAIEKTQARRSP